MKRREFLQAGGAAAAATLAPLTSRSEDRPNVLIILSDQLRAPHRMPWFKTPNMDRLAASGVSWSNHFTSAVPCSPSRACLLTGLYTIQNQLYLNVDVVSPHQQSLAHRYPTIGNVFTDAGYSCAYRGKWHLTRSWDRNALDPLLDYGFTGWRGPDAPIGGTAYCGAIEDPRTTRQTIHFLEHPPAAPWLLVCSLVNPHDICWYPGSYPQARRREVRAAAPPENWSDDLTGKPSAQKLFAEKYKIAAGKLDPTDPLAWRRYMDFYADQVLDMDANLGLVLDALERSGQPDRTIVVLTSDHGEQAGSHQLRTKGPFVYEESLNIPLIFSWPGHLPSGRVTAAMSSNIDVAPTLASLAGIKRLPYMAGRDLSPALLDPSRGDDREEVICHVTGSTEPVGGGYDLLLNVGHIRSIRTREWKYVHYFDPNGTAEEFELYDLNNDPLELHNLGADPGYQARRKELHGRLREREQALVKESESAR
jgi:arylsulfatase A-like enzyme